MRARVALIGAGLVFAFVLLGAGSPVALAATAAPVFTADTPPALQLDVPFGGSNSCACSYNNQDGYAFVASGSPVPTYSVSSGALPTGMFLDPANGLLYGAPTSGGQSYSFSISASNGVAPDAVAGPFTGTLAPPCAPFGSGGSQDTTTTSSRLVATSPAVSVALPDVSAAVTEVVGRVIRNGTATVVYDQQVPVAVSDPRAQGLLAAAAAADANAAPGSSVAAPALASTMTTTSAPSQVSQIVPGPPLPGPLTAASTVNIGPVTIHVGQLQSCTFTVSPGSEDIDTLVSEPQASATDVEQSTATTTSVYDVDATVSVPANTSRPVISGEAKAGKSLSCSKGSWTQSPTSFAYGWSLSGTPIQGASKPTYTVQKIDEQLTLTCNVTASNLIGKSSPATSTGVMVPVPHVTGCPAATGRLDGTTLGLVKLGITRKQARSKYTHSSNRGKKFEDFFCLTPIGVRVGYASPKLLDTLPKAKRAKFKDRVIWASTSSAFYTLKGVRAGATIAAASKKLKLGKPFHIGKNIWYLASNGSSTAVLKVRQGIVEEIGIGDKALTTGHKAQVNFLNSFS